MESVLLVKTSSLGDVIHNLPVVSDIRRTWSEVTPPEAGNFADDGTLLAVDPGAEVAYRVLPYVVFRWKGIRTYPLVISSAAGGELAEGKIVWRRGDCPTIE